MRRARLVSRIRWVRDSWNEYRSLFRALGIQGGEWVLDVGSGAHRFPRADILCSPVMLTGREASESPAGA
jgi:hypothetical protein